jgi:hypothetical protein
MPARDTVAADPGSRDPSHQAIERRAYELYLASGCQPGHELQHWLAAEAELVGRGRARS